MVGAAAAFVLVKLAIAYMPMAVPRLQTVAIDSRVMMFALATICVTTLLFGLLPALVVSRAESRDALRLGTRSPSSGGARRWNRLSGVSEVALACAVLVGSALLVRSVARMLRAPIGVVSSDVVVARLQLSGGSYATWDNVQQFYTTLLGEIRVQPGIESAGAATALPLDTGWATRLPYIIEGQPLPPPHTPLPHPLSITP